MNRYTRLASAVVRILGALLLPFSGRADALVPPDQQMTDFKARAGTIDDVFTRLSAMGIDTKALTASLREDYKYLLDAAYLHRAEVFKTNLDTDPQKEFVSQLVFYNHKRQGVAGLDGEILYIVSIHDDSKHGYRVLKTVLFQEILCEYQDILGNAVTFGFKALAHGRFKQVIFTVKVVDSCALVMGSSKRRDTLRLDEKKEAWIFTEGVPEQVGVPLNRMDLAE